ncbi:MAG: HEPN domain-containing protein [Candidatus Bathyarchaeia archaeon]
MEIDPLEEVAYRLSLAREHFQAALKRMRVDDWVGVVQASQLAAENAAKAVIAYFMIPSWSHDPSDELLEICGRLPPSLQEEARELAAITHELAPEHGRTSYGMLEQRLTPSAIYDRETAEKVVKAAEKALSLARHMLTRLGYPAQ